jgi:hypothetical protein
VRKKAPSKNPPARGAGAKKPKQGSQPDILVAYTPAGRDTMDAIASELVPKSLVTVERDVSSPEISIREAVAGRETLAAILEEARPEPRPPQTTLRYGDRVSNAPGAKTPSSAPRRLASPKPTAPEGRSAAPAAHAASAPSSVEIFEMMTYVVRGIEPSRLSSEALRRQFVAENLLSRLPTPSMDAVDRVDVTPWTVQGTLVVRVWCRLPPNPAGT